VFSGHLFFIFTTFLAQAMSTHHKKLSVCPNCGTPLKPEDNFCPHCGQENHDLKVPFSHLVLEVFESVFHFETKFFNTIKVIFTRPGRITRDFWEGKRARYMHPFRLYVFVSFLFFLIANKVADKTAHEVGESLKKNERSYKTQEVELSDLISHGPRKDDQEILKQDGLQDFGKIEVKLPVDSLPRRQFISRLKQADEARLDSLLGRERLEKSAGNRAQLRRALALIPDLPHLSSQLQVGSVTISFNSPEERHVFARKLKDFSDTQVDSLLTAQNAEPNRLNRTLLRQFAKFDLADEHFFHDVAHAFMKNLSLVMFILMPFVALLLLIVFYSRKRYYFEHLIFAIHAHTIFFILFAITLTIDYFAHSNLSTDYAFLIGWIYFFLSLKTVYQQGWLKTTAKFLLLSLLYFFVAAVFMSGALLWGFMSL